MLNRWTVLYAPDGEGGGGTLLSGEQPTEGNPQEQNNTPDPTNNPDEGKESEPGWLSGLPVDLRKNEWLKGFQKPGEFATEALSMKDKLERAIIKPGEDATEDELVAYRKEIGVPIKADDYDLPKHELVTDDFTKSQRELYLKHGLSQDQAKAVHEAVLKQVNDGAEVLQKANKEARESAEATLKKEWGEKYTDNLKSAQKALRKFSTPDDMAYLEKSGLGNDAGLIRLFHKVNESISDDSLLSPSQRSGAPDEIKQRFPNSPTMWNN